LHGSEAFICKALKAETIVKLCLDFNPPASPERLAMAGVVTQQMEASGSPRCLKGEK
jgi:hypothetical protein